MSRHKLVKNLDLDDELDDFDGGEYYADDGVEAGIVFEELSEEDQDNMRAGTTAVRSELPGDISHVTDKQIYEALWFYYYDIQKSVDYLAKTYGPRIKAQKKKKVQGGSFSFSENGAAKHGCRSKLAPEDCERPFSFADFFKDTPWLNLPADRQAILIAPLYPRGGLLGGASDGAPKISKLQALAAARKKKAQDERSSGSPKVENPMAGLSIGNEQRIPENQASKLGPRSFPIRKRKDSNPHEKPPAKHQHISHSVEIPVENEPAPASDQAPPSEFASTMFSGTFLPQRRLDNLFTLPYIATVPSPAADPFAGPSPDDVVIAAQSKANGKEIKGLSKTNGEKKADQIANGVENMRVDDTPRATSKNLDVLKEYEIAKRKNAANFVVIGHVDAGKSTLMGRLLYDLKVVDERTIERYKKEAEQMGKSSFALAWVLDQGTEERSRGVTIDIATNKFETSKTAFTILDAPGHKDFIPNMIAGASQADFAVLVIDASTGSFESGLKGQTREHALLVRSLGVQRIIIAVNKLDTVLWSQDRFSNIEQQITAFLLTAGFQAKNVAFIPCSGLVGDNITRRSENKAASWYSGPTLVEELDNSEPITRAVDKALRLTIGDVFRGGVQNPLSISGRIEVGSLQTGDALLAQPSGMKCFIRALEVDSAPVDWAVAGQNITIHLSGIEEQYLKSGDVLSSPSNPIQNVREFTVKSLAFEFITPMQVDVHRGRLHAAGRIKQIVTVLDKSTGIATGKKKPKIVKPNQVARLVVEMDVDVPLEAPARVVLRSGGETIAAGLIE